MFVGTYNKKSVEQVDINQFMGKWYVIANIPTFLEKGAHNAVESYTLDSDATIATTFTLRDKSFDGPGQRISSPRFYQE